MSVKQIGVGMVNFKKFLLTSVMIGFLAVPNCLAQQPEFEVASIKRSPPPSGPRIRVEVNGGPGTADPTLFTCRNCSLSMLLMHAYGVKYYQISRLGSWNNELFSIAARVPAGATKEQFHLMLQYLLADRFKLAFHREMKHMQMYNLILARSSQRLAESNKNVAPAMEGRIRIWGVQESMEELAERLSNQLDLPVTDSTGLKGKYDFRLNWALAPDDSGPDLLSAIQSQLGLKLAPKKGPVSLIVIDHAEKVPTEN